MTLGARAVEKRRSIKTMPAPQPIHRARILPMVVPPKVFGTRRETGRANEPVGVRDRRDSSRSHPNDAATLSVPGRSERDRSVGGAMASTVLDAERRRSLARVGFFETLRWSPPEFASAVEL